MKEMLRMIIWMLLGLAVIAAVQGCSGGQLKGGQQLKTEEGIGQPMIDQAMISELTKPQVSEAMPGEEPKEAKTAEEAVQPSLDETFVSNFFPAEKQPELKGLVDTKAFFNSKFWSENLKSKEIVDKVAKIESEFKVNAEMITSVLFGCKKGQDKRCEQFLAIAELDGKVDFSTFKDYEVVDQIDQSEVYFKSPNYLAVFPEGKKNVVIYGTKEYFMYAANNLKRNSIDSLKTGYLFVIVASVSPSEYGNLDIFKTPVGRFRAVLTGTLGEKVVGITFASYVDNNPILNSSFAVDFDNVDFAKVGKLIAQKSEEAKEGEAESVIKAE